MTPARRLTMAACLAGAAFLTPATAAETWDCSIAANGYLFPGAGDFLLGIGTADRGPLHLEARYNYEARDTASIFGGWNWSTGDTVKLALTPMLGIAAGDTDAILPGFELGLAWKRLDFYLESEIALDLHDRADNFVYAWSEFGWTPVDWLRVGFAGQRTRLVDTGLDIQRGILAQAIVGRFTFGADWFNPASDDEFVVAILGVEF
jgi:hypothetical protein